MRYLLLCISLLLLASSAFGSSDTTEPDGVGSPDEFTRNGGSTKYGVVTDETDANYIHSSTQDQDQAFTMSDVSLGGATIDSVVFHARMAGDFGTDVHFYFVTGTDTARVKRCQACSQWTDFDSTTTTQADGSTAWTEAAINSMTIFFNAQVGFGSDGYVTETWAEVFYTETSGQVIMIQ